MAALVYSWVPCLRCVLPQPCPPNTVTPDQVTLPSIMTQLSPLLTSPTLCATKPGYGWEDTTAVPCPIGYWAAGGLRWWDWGSWQLAVVSQHTAISAISGHT